VNVIDLAVQCVNSINGSTVIGSKMEDASILVVTPKGWKAPPKFPRGSIVQWKEDGSRIRYLPAMKVLAWLAAQGLVKVDAQKP
jgi:hypothetical protein